MLSLLDGVDANWDIKALALSANNDYDAAKQSRKQWDFENRQMLESDEAESSSSSEEGWLTLRPQEIRIFEAKRKWLII